MNKYVVLISAVLLYFMSAYFSYAFFSGNTGSLATIVSPIIETDTQYKAPGENGVIAEFEGPRDQECPVNGKMLTKKHKDLWETRRPLGVMIENHTEARPQSGINSADVTYEVVAEGGITRFLNIFYCEDAPFVGPVRSARVYFISLLQGYGDYPLYAHVGGANTPGPADALGMINRLKWAQYNDLNQFSISFPTYYRDYGRLKDVATEHTMYSSTQKLWTFAKTKRKLTNVDEDGKSWDASFKPWIFKEAGSATQGDPATTISYDFWQGKSSFTAKWVYDPKVQVYSRSTGGEPHLDKNSGKPLEAYNVIVAYMKESPANDGYEGHHLLYKTTGTGDAVLFQGGTAQKVTWKKPENTDQIRFYKGSQEISFNRGKIWVSIIPVESKPTVSYQ